MRKTIFLAMLAVLPHAARAQDTPPVALSLARAVAVAADTAPAVRIAELRTAEAQARVAQARGSLLPSVSAAAGVVDQTRNRNTFGISFPSAPGTTTPDRIGPYDVYDARVRVAAPVYDPAGIARVRVQRAAVAGSEAERAAAAEGARQRAALAYVRAERAQAAVSARMEDVRLAEELVELARAQLDRGVAAGIDVVRAQTQVAAARGLLSVARNQAAQAQVELARALGVDPATRFALTDTLATDGVHPGAPAADAAVETALARRPELQAEEARLRAAQAGSRALWAERLPRVDVLADYGYSGVQPTDGIATYQVGVQVSVPVWDGNRRGAREAEQSAVAAEAGVRSADVRGQVAAEVRSALLDVSSAGEQTEIAADRLRLAQEELSQARERFANGIAGNIEVINAQQSLVRARDAVIDAGFATAAARVALARATGTTDTLR
ncbi:MAG TPA: TolC family protein [Longimicrobium sp.]|jgi:outer membrane protein TolC|uniref:TolC family protein n=1 Tax=Longimicrobium sp. TaxID=2029185 RepID=UPI002ED8282E